MLNFNKLLLWIVLFIAETQVHASELCPSFENSAIKATTPSRDFTDNGDGTVTHQITGLIWQRCSLGQSWDGTHCTGEASVFTWAGALAAAAQNTFSGLSDWRLPNKNELASIVEYRCTGPAINSQQFPNTPSRWSWSSSPNARYSDASWGIGFRHGDVDYGHKTFSRGNVRLVRDPLGEPSGEPGIEIINGSPENRKDDRATGQ